MSNTELSTLRSRLLAIPASEVEAPDLPVAVALQVVHDEVEHRAPEDILADLRCCRRRCLDPIQHALDIT